MLAMAQALMAKPIVLLLDEPSLGLAPIYVDTIFSIISQIASKEGCSILLVEQNVAKALEVSDYVFLLNCGILSGKGSSEQFRADPSIISKNLGFY
jgi:branched-chain amino acid transport system ATP-binding protein